MAQKYSPSLYVVGIANFLRRGDNHLLSDTRCEDVPGHILLFRPESLFAGEEATAYSGREERSLSLIYLKAEKSSSKS